MKSPGAQDDTEYQKVSEKRNNDDEPIDTHNCVVSDTEFILKHDRSLDFRCSLNQHAAYLEKFAEYIR